MALKVDNKVYRNLPEQVAKNTDDIEELKQSIPIPSNVYTKDEIDALLLTKVSKSPLTNRLYATDENNNQTTVIYAKEVAQANSIPQRNEAGQIVSGAFDGTEANNVLTPKKYVDDKLASDLTPQTIAQQQPNWSYNLSSLTPTVISGDFVATNIFSRLQVINKELEIIFTFKLINNGAASATPSNVQLPLITIPEEIGKKIIDVEGNDLTTGGSEKAIAGTSLCNTGIGVGVTHNVFIQRNGVLSISHQAANTMRIACYSLSSMGANTEVIYSGRIQLTLL